MGGGGSPGPRVDLSGCFGDVWALADDAEREEALRVIGKPSELTQAAKLASLPEWARWRDTIVSALTTAEDEGGVFLALLRAQQDLAEDEAIAASLYETQLQAHMAGQLFVRAIEVPETLPQPVDVPEEPERRSPKVGQYSGLETMPADLSARRRVLDATADGRPSYFRLNFREALETFLARGLVTAEEFQQLSAEARAQSWSATRLASQHLVERARDLLARHLEQGGTLAEFIAQMESGAVTLGVEPASPYYAETIYRSSVQTAYGAGRIRQMDTPAVQQARPFVEYRTAGDTRVRPSHAALHGVIFDRSNDGGWQRFAPPLGFNCRCSLVTLRKDRVDPARVRNSAELAAEGLGVDPGWAGPAAQTPEQG